MRNADLDKQILASQKIIEIAKSNELMIKDISPYVRTFRRRWYDVDEELCMAMEYLKTASLEIQKKIAIEVINFLCEMEN
ncbi:MAG: hypothetical protein A2039_08680 [Candidatus Melainabacteria bacterium GWA2_34_9]|nr:MAG: hypothetical protein A2039_08680 [Candidatus Melainabacteria bacterium GWA2_34_9]